MVGENEDRWGLSVVGLKDTEGRGGGRSGKKRISRYSALGNRPPALLKRNLVDRQFCRLHKSNRLVWTSWFAYLEST